MSISLNARYLPPNPCMGCKPPKRGAGCHCRCEEYKSFAAECKAERERHIKEVSVKDESLHYSRIVLAKHRDRRVNSHRV